MPPLFPEPLDLDCVHQGDCLDLLTRVPSESVHLAFADPPFNIGYAYDAYDDRRTAADYLGWSKRWLGEIIRVLRPDGTFWLAIGDEYAAELKVMATRELGLTCRSWVVWYYTFGVHCKSKFARSHAHLFHFVKDPVSFTFNVDAIRVPSARELVYADKRANSAGRLPDDTWILRPQDLPEGFTADGDTWYFPRVCPRGRHGARSLRRQRHDAGRRQEAPPPVSRLRTLGAIRRAGPRATDEHLPRPAARRGGRAAQERADHDPRPAAEEVG